MQQYWTAERMRNAEPGRQGSCRASSRRAAPRCRKLAPAQQIPPPYTSQPTSTNGKVFFTDGGLELRLLRHRRAERQQEHGVDRRPLRPRRRQHFHTNWSFVPAYADGARPYGTWTARTLLTTSGWANGGDFSFDNGAAVVNLNGGQALTDVVGGRNIAVQHRAQPERTSSHGYPAAPPFNGQRLWVCNSPLIYDDTSANPPTMGIDCDMTGGSSGGGWIAGGAVASVNSYGYTTLPNVMFGPYQGAVAQSLYTQAAGS